MENLIIDYCLFTKVTMLLDWTTTGWESQVGIYASRSYLYMNGVSVILNLIQGFYSGNSGFSPYQN